MTFSFIDLFNSNRLPQRVIDTGPKSTKTRQRQSRDWRARAMQAAAEHGNFSHAAYNEVKIRQNNW